MRNRIVTVVGGSGFVGRYVVKLLAEAGYTIRVLCRDTQGAIALKTSGEVGQIVLQYANLAKPETLEGKLDGSWAVVNLVGILFERGRQNFGLIHAQGAERLAKLAKAAGAERFIHMSTLGVDKSVRSKYARTKALGEKAVQAAFPQATVLRPSVIFGAEDGFFNKFAQMARVLPALPLIGGGKTLFQPVYVDDVAQAIVRILAQENTKGKTYDLGGPRSYSFKELMQYILKITERKRLLLPIPFPLATLMGAICELAPVPPITADQVRMLQYDNIVGKKANGFAELGMMPSAIETIVPEYLNRYRNPKAAIAVPLSAT